MNKTALVVGGGLAGMTAALQAGQPELRGLSRGKRGELGGNLRRIYTTADGLDVQEFLERYDGKGHEPSADPCDDRDDDVDHAGFKGNFETGISIGPTKAYQKLKHGIIVIATGG